MSFFNRTLQIYLKQQLSGSSKNYHLFWIFMVVYTFGYLLYTIEFHIQQIIVLTMSIGLAGIAYSSYKLIKFKIKNSYFQFTFTLYFLWELYIILQGVGDFNYTMLRVSLFQPYTFLFYLIPLVILFQFNIFSFKTMSAIFEKLNISLFIVFLFFFDAILISNQNFSEQCVWSLGTGAGFILLTWSLHSNKTRTIAILTVILCLFIATVMARRNIMLTFSNYLIFAFILYITNSKRKLRQKIYFSVIAFFITTCGYIMYNSYQDSLFGKITDRIDADSREVVFTAFFTELNNNDFIYGKGMNGTYYCPGVDDDSDERPLIENGFLQIILKGGIIYLALFLLIAIPAIVLGIKSRNPLGKAAGVIVFLWIIDMVAWGMPAMNIRYILLWTCIGIAYTKEICELSENELKQSLILFKR